MKKDLFPSNDTVLQPGEIVQPKDHPGTKPGFLETIFFGPHQINGEEINEEENAAIIQQLVGWSRME
jgi:hypothetical protein